MSKILVIGVFMSFSLFFICNSTVIKRSPCKEDEMHVTCAHCAPKTCDQLGYPIQCGSSCTSDCVCFEGMVRNASGVCILTRDCSSCGGDANATSGCGNHCGRSCSDHQDTNKTCLTGCRGNSCDCREGYVYNERLHHCTLPEDC